MQYQVNRPLTETREDKIKHLEEQIADLKNRLPAHSIPPTMIQELDDLEEELEQLQHPPKAK